MNSDASSHVFFQSFFVKFFIATVVVLIVIAGTAWAILNRINQQENTVINEQEKRADEKTIKSLKDTISLVELYYDKASEIDNKRTGQNRPLEKRLPSMKSHLSLVSQEAAQITKGSDYEFSNPSTYKVCANFLTSNYPERSPISFGSLFQKPQIDMPNVPGAWFHEQGYHCYEIKVGTGAQLETAPAKYGTPSEKKNTDYKQEGSGIGDNF